MSTATRLLSWVLSNSPFIFDNLLTIQGPDQSIKLRSPVPRVHTLNTPGSPGREHLVLFAFLAGSQGFASHQDSRATRLSNRGQVQTLTSYKALTRTTRSWAPWTQPGGCLGPGRGVRPRGRIQRRGFWLYGGVFTTKQHSPKNVTSLHSRFIQSEKIPKKLLRKNVN